MTIHYRVAPGARLQGQLRVPGDKSISHRAVLLGALADGVTHVSGFLEGEDTRATAAAMRQMGVTLEADGEGALRIVGAGVDGLRVPDSAIDMGNSGTGMRLLAGVLAGQSFCSRVVGDESLSSRPMGRIARPLTAMGAQIALAAGDRPPLDFAASTGLRALSYEMPVASAQVKSCLLLAGLYAGGDTRVHEPAPCRDHTERMLRGFGYEVVRDGHWTQLSGGGRLRAQDVEVPADISSAAFFLVAASITPGADLLLEHVGMNATRDGVIHILRAMGADIELVNERQVSGEPVADVRVRGSELRGVEVPAHLVANAIDEFPALFVAAAAADGCTVLAGAEELRVKESDRIAAMAAGLTTLGATLEQTPDGMVITGLAGGAEVFTGGEVDSFGDHRIAMALTMAGAVSRAPVVVRNCDNVNTSFPGFVQIAAVAGLAIDVLEED
jgi:3-phosphoshikimate 1-carboxyvinyltransferase